MREIRTWPSCFFVSFFFLSLTRASAQAYLPVYEESRHRLIYEDTDLRILHVTCEPGDTTEYHRHCHPIFYFTLKGATVGLNKPNGLWKEVVIPEKWMGHDAYHTDSCFVHRFSVLGSSPLEIMAVELKEDFQSSAPEKEALYKSNGIEFYDIGPQDDDFIRRNREVKVLIIEDLESSSDFSRVSFLPLREVELERQGTSIYLLRSGFYSQE